MPSGPAVTLGPGALVGAYRLERELGRGGMGVVHLARHVVLPRHAAIKIMHAELRAHPGMATRVVQEAAILEDIRHPGIVRVYECNLLADHRPWIAMELVEGGTLAQRIASRKVLEATEVARLLADVGDVLAAVHARGVVHRDLKPDNLILTPDDHDFPLRVIDWGVARLGPVGRLTLEGLTPGTPIYMAPEQAMGRHIGAACDVYSLGVIAYEALTGHPPFDGRTLAEVVAMHLAGEPAPLARLASVPPELAHLVHHMLAKAPADRPGAIEVRQRARAMAVDLASAYESYQVTTRPPGSTHDDATVVVDAELLEFGVTELLPVIRNPRWTPEIGYLLQAPAPATTPRCPSPDIPMVSGEIVGGRRR